MKFLNQKHFRSVEITQINRNMFSLHTPLHKHLSLLPNTQIFTRFQGIMLFLMVSHTPLKYNSYVYPAWATGFGLALALSSMVCIPIGALHQFVTGRGRTLKEVSFFSCFLIVYLKKTFNFIFYKTI